MRVEQAVFTSARTTRLHGYHLVSCSPGVNTDLAQSLNRWGPSHASLASTTIHATSINFHPVIDGWLAISRTVYGGPEYSNRGGLQLFTRSLVFQRDQMARFRSDAVSLARLLTALGHLRFQADTPRRLAPVTLPDRISTAWMPDITSDADRVMVDRLLRFVDQASVAVIGANDPMAVLMAVLSRMPERGRLELSFTTGLKPSIYRPFRIQFLPSVDATLQRHLNSQGVSILEVQN